MPGRDAYLDGLLDGHLAPFGGPKYCWFKGRKRVAAPTGLAAKPTPPVAQRAVLGHFT
jgi:hypothetical protein